MTAPQRRPALRLLAASLLALVGACGRPPAPAPEPQAGTAPASAEPAPSEPRPRAQFPCAPVGQIARNPPRSELYPWSDDEVGVTDELASLYLESAPFIVLADIVETGVACQEGPAGGESVCWARVRAREFLKGAASDVVPSQRDEFPIYGPGTPEVPHHGPVPNVACTLVGLQGRAVVLHVALGLSSPEAANRAAYPPPPAPVASMPGASLATTLVCGPAPAGSAPRFRRLVAAQGTAGER